MNKYPPADKHCSAESRKCQSEYDGVASVAVTTVTGRLDESATRERMFTVA